uniref:Uncharacterized protein n=1 Tax=Anguilla anguilla TaxID=7936 RepID=A0A0E9XAS2_ANGAN
MLLRSLLHRCWGSLITWFGPSCEPPCSTPGSPSNMLTRSSRAPVCERASFFNSISGLLCF